MANGKLPSHFWQLLDMLKELQLDFIVVSGRSLSWGHFILTHFPLDLCVMEGGGVVIHKGKNGILVEEILASEVNLLELQETKTALEKKFPGTLSVDSFGRKTDCAVDLKLVDKKGKEDIESFLADRGAAFSSSNVHINFWYGDISKYNAIEWVLKNNFPEVPIGDCLYFGDAPNDQSIFEKMKHTVGVSNIIDHLDSMDHHPEVILRGEGNVSVKGVYNFLKVLFNHLR